MNFDVLVNTPEQTVDMKAGLQTFQGTSETIRHIAEALLTGKSPERLSYKSKIRTNLKQTFKGSYGQTFSLDIYDAELDEKFKKIGKKNFAELANYFVSEALYLETQEITQKSRKIIDSLGDEADSLIEQLRVSCLENAHEISEKFGHDVKIRYRASRENQIEIAKLNQETVLSLQAKPENKTEDLKVSITRLNINTGNGRLLIEDEEETVAFGFGVIYKEVKLEAKKLFSKNLDMNNGMERENWIKLKISARPIKLKSGKIVKYIVTGFYND